MSDIIDEIVDYASKKSKYAEARYIESEVNQFSMRDGSFQGGSSSRDMGYMIRVLNNSISIAYSDSQDFNEVKEVIDAAVESSMRPGKDKLNTESFGTAKWSVDARKKPADMSPEEKISVLKQMDSVMEETKCAVRMNHIIDAVTRTVYRNSNGSNIESESTRVAYFYMFGIMDGGNFEQSTGEYGSSSGYEYIESLNLQDIISDEAKVLRKAATAHRIEPGVMDVVVGPEISGIVAHESCGHPTEYDRIIGREGALAGESFLKVSNIPYKVGSEHVSVIDDPTVKGSFGYYMYDDEGVKAGKRYLYHKGMTDEFILNRESAAILGKEPNGGGRSSGWDREPLARMSTTYIEPGDYTFDDLVSDIKNGVYIKSYTEWNIDDIRFNEKYVGKEAYLIRNGRIEEVVRRPIIETTTVKFYSSIDACGNDPKFFGGLCGKGDPEQGVPVWMGGPHVRLRGMYIK